MWLRGSSLVLNAVLLFKKDIDVSQVVDTYLYVRRVIVFIHLVLSNDTDVLQYLYFT